MPEDARLKMRALVRALEEHGPNLPRPYADKLDNDAGLDLRELRLRHMNHFYRAVYVWEKTRNALVLTGGDKTGKAADKDDVWYKRLIKKAVRSYREYE